MPKSKSRKKKPPERVLGAPGRRARQDGRAEQPDVASGQPTSISEFVAGYSSEPRPAFNRTFVL